MLRIKNFILNNSYFNLDDELGDTLVFATRRHGIMKDEGEFPGELDIEEARRVRQLLFENFKDLSIEVSGCGEWVYLIIKENE